MKIAIIGAGFTGLSAAYFLSKKRYDVSVFEKEKTPGGLAIGFKNNNWDWYLDRYYHHIFTSDMNIRKLSDEIGIKIIFTRPKTKSLIDHKIYSFDTPMDVIKFDKLSLVERLRMGLVLAYLKINPFWQSLENISADNFLPKFMGNNPYRVLWEPLLSSKFGEYKKEIPLSWFWARIKKRSAQLGYPEGGFQNLANRIEARLKNRGVKFYFQTEVKEIRKESNKFKISDFYFDKVIFTPSCEVFLKMVKDLPKDYVSRLKKLKTLAFLNLVLILKKQFLADGTYWLNVCNKNYPFLSVIEHTNFIDKKYYGNQHLVYIGKYLDTNDPILSKSPSELLEIYDPYLKKINPTYRFSLIAYHLFADFYAQPVITLNYSKIIPSLETPIENLSLANMQQVYPWDRGVNYAVELGERVANEILQK